MKRHILSLIALVAASFTSCSTVHVFPDEEPFDPTLIKTDITLKANLVDFDITQNDDFPLEVSAGQLPRFIVEVYKFDDKQKAVFREEVLLESKDDLKEVDIPLQLSATKYRVVAWLDYSTTTGDQYYTTANGLRNIELVQPLSVPLDDKDAAFGYTDIDLTQYKDEWGVDVQVKVNLERPISKYYLIANDIEKYISKELSKSNDVQRASIESYKVEVTYNGYAPTMFDSYTGELSDAVTGLTYTCGIEVINDNEAIIAMDLPLTDKGDDDIANVGIKIFNQDGELVNENDNIDIPISRGELTVIRSDFFTRNVSSGITVDTDFDGTIDVEVN